MAAEGDGIWDVVVIGGGPPGENAAQYAIQGTGRSAVIVEHELVGGECSYWACMPSKALLRPIELLGAARAMPGVRGIVAGREVDVAEVLARRDGFTSNHDDASQVAWAKGIGIDVLRGHGRLVGERAVEVTGPDGSVRVLRARHAVVIATGTTAAVPPVDGLRAALPWTSRDVTNLHEVPRRVVVLGGGVVACESALWLRGLGAEEVTVLERGPGLLSKSEPFAGRLVADRFAELGVRVLTGTSLESVRRDDPKDTGEGRVHGGAVHVTAAGTGITADELVVAAGRTPSTGDLGLGAVGLAEGGYVDVEDHLGVRGVAGEWLYAVGDVNGRALLTHMGKYQARVCGSVIAARAEGRAVDGPRFRASADHAQVPQVAFTDPQVASVGLTEAAAREAGTDVETVELDLAALAGSALLRDDYKGRAKLVIDRATDVLVGATFVGPETAELVHAATIAVVGKVPMETLWHAVPSYPTVSEIWLRLLESRGS
ncbi:dihydrolipoamide dehydrogenase [Murinocardiopsis flavida]|uniref:Dihydrolipoamide dehydrogenase n=1 Tax=Murinocardiopsis flavida TaxID=645275 RepID=A0A2P8DLV0_9ACTN|nr:NAD(P)/FAD-dependent oxidoreductase [Murinocardiopsis flavida]PSK98196.1 dihydrolipoamide dehydrogenase [Murinocardiopsis flavida]